MKKLSLFIILFCLSSSAISQVYSSRNTLNYYLGSYALHVIITDPIQANQPVYSWRTHTKFDGTPGPLGYNGTYIGHTDSNGQLVIFAPKLPYNPVYCGKYHGERVAVGSKNSPKSNYLNFKIEVPMIGPLPPWTNECRMNYSKNMK